MKFLNKILILILLATTAASCINTKSILYLQDMGHETQISLEDKFEAKISNYDQLSIIISCADMELAKPFNAINSTSLRTNNSNEGSYGYLVDVNGNINFPVLGDIMVAGLTRLEVQNKIEQMLIEGGYIQDPFVYVRFLNFKIFFLGADGGKTINVPNERCTFLQALAMSGDLSVYTKRAKIAVLREVDGKMVMRYLDPRSSEVFNDPFYLLQQNDFIITQSQRSKYVRDELNYWISFLTIITSLASIASLVIACLALGK